MESAREPADIVNLIMTYIEDIKKAQAESLIDTVWRLMG